ncbi:MAG: transcriptional regulator [Actinobacteria bacterium]|nr:transcriptional regulator [Actinomycetota bacterium]
MVSEARVEEGLDEADVAYGKVVGGRLRAIRRQKGLSLQEAEEASGQEFKASVLGAYERGERAISVPRLQRLARFYNVPVDQLLPRPETNGRSGEGDGVLDLTRPLPAPPRKVTIDLTRLDALHGAAAEMLGRYLTMIQVQRGDFNGRMLTIRRDDLRAIACILDTTVDTATDRLDEMGLCLSR